MQPESSRLVAPNLVDNPLQEPRSQPLADELGHQAELHQLNLVGLSVDMPLFYRLVHRSGRIVADPSSPYLLPKMFDEDADESMDFHTDIPLLLVACQKT